MSKTISISKRMGYIIAAGALLVVIIVWIVTVQKRNQLLNPDTPSTTEPTPYK
jgi:hypothetical protein